MQPSRVKHPVIPQHVRLLEVAQRAPLCLSPDRQPYIISPLTATAVPLYSEAFFDWFTHATEARLGLCPSSSQIARVIRDLDSGARKAQATEQIHTRIAKKATKHYQIDLGTPNIDVVELTGKNWQVSQHFDARFQRLETSDPMPIPQPSPVKLPVYLENMFGISVENAHKLSGWLAQAMLPEQKPPILVINGEASDEAVTKLRTLIDPVFHALIEMPTTAKQMAQQAIENRVLAYTITGPLSESKIQAFNKMRKGVTSRLRQANKKLAPLYTIVHRPIMIASEEKIEISPQQLTIEISKSLPVRDLDDMLGALLDVVVEIVGQPVIYPESLVFRAPAIAPSPDCQQPTVPPPEKLN